MMWFDAGWVKSCRESKASDPTHKPAFISQDAAPPLLCSSCPKRDADTDYVMTHTRKTLPIHAHQAGLVVVSESYILSGNVDSLLIRLRGGHWPRMTSSFGLSPGYTHMQPQKDAESIDQGTETLPSQMAFGLILQTRIAALLPTNLPAR